MTRHTQVRPWLGWTAGQPGGQCRGCSLCLCVCISLSLCLCLSLHLSLSLCLCVSLCLCLSVGLCLCLSTWSLLWLPSESSLSRGDYPSRCPKRSGLSRVAPWLGASGDPWSMEPNWGVVGSPGRGQPSQSPTARARTQPPDQILSHPHAALQSSGPAGSFRPPLPSGGFALQLPSTCPVS